MAVIAELNNILERAVNLKDFLKGMDRIQKVAQFVARHSRENVEPLGCKAFLVGVDSEACALYNHAQERFLPAGYSEVVCTGNTNDNVLLKPKLWDDVIVHELLHFLRSQPWQALENPGARPPG